MDQLLKHKFFNHETIDDIKLKVINRLPNVDKNLLTYKYVTHAMNLIFIRNKDLFKKIEFDLIIMTEETVNYITLELKNQVNNNCQKYTVWNSLLGDFNNQGLRAHSYIKVIPSKRRNILNEHGT
jgi:hypothetical protein